ncbi:serine/threonine-protein kinase pim-1-like [Anarrhichthys ocellatus]|uniref:serine/threonine-protein kinase pim-1-like n=1 Tax=Anarrhichthys ocellatus TaxID=433405 RepID=UPI0012ECD0C9|nr:serine/threonine-protein kinase pim-1-like [Anarrhichthys ocellatus]
MPSPSSDHMRPGTVLQQEELRVHCTSVTSDNGSEGFIPVLNSSQDRSSYTTKRKASTESATHGKKKRGDNTDSNTGEPTKMSVEDIRETDKEEAAKFEEKYLQLKTFWFELKKLVGGFGSVYAGNIKTDHLPVAIKHIPKVDVESRPMVFNGRTHMAEALLMLRAGGEPASAAVSLIDWYALDQEVLLVMERPVPCVDLSTYVVNNNGLLRVDQAKNIMKQLVEAAIKMHSEAVFHRDIKTENVLVETNSNVPRVRIIDFGCGCYMKKRPYRHYSGTAGYAPPEFYSQGKYEALLSTLNNKKM